MPLLLVLVFVVVPIAELYVIIQVGEAIGVLPTIALLIADSVLGSWLVRAQGRAAWRRFRLAVEAGRVPAREVLDGVLIVFGGALLLAPGFLTDLVALTLLLPPARALVRRALLRRAGTGFPLRSAGRRRPDASRPDDVEGTGREAPPDRLSS